MGIANKLAVGNLVRVWNLVKGFSGDDLRRMQTADARLAIVGESSARAWALDELGAGIGDLHEYVSTRSAHDAGETIMLEVDNLQRDSDSFNTALAALALRHRDRRIALAVKYPAFRSIVTDQLTREAAQHNAKLAAMSALPGIIPVFDWLLPATAAGDMIVLTRNQINLLLQIAACYNLPPEPRERIAELIPVVGGAFGWRALAREALGIVPGGVGVVVKAGVAFAGTYAVGRAASYFYASGGKKLNVNQTFQTALSDAMSRGLSLIGKGKRDPS